ncbi:two-component system alkaline phosphatase synthesis response regulator PhoP [Catalinimonas alkaloidigena]|uniref:response regulator transcription factor n=1 Tax=Catalinimonas alkaloidigena TaxID=1075417 RepID=UPI0024052E13|nr:response regulator transcription factor [Catalinimonas alkaloidigena]MDF9797116.1 two-component system alkaline phosphatase synthesis response regulator PhoP [Catalinimonas alkaloidigena]
MKEVLIVEDDSEIVDLLEIHLIDLECKIEKAHDGNLGLQKALNHCFDLIILDIMLPGIDGLEICRKIRGKEKYTPILMLTAKSEEIDKILGLETGADDYLTKPFSVREFISRVRAIFRRVEMIQGNQQETDKKKVLKADGLHMDAEKRSVEIHGERLALTPKEFDLLWIMAAHPGRSYSRQELLNLVWGYEFSGYEHTVNAHINRLRSKIERNVSEPQYILTTWGIGYRFNDE